MEDRHNTRSRKLPHAVIVRAPGLLPMLYKVSELAEELDVPYSTLRDWLHQGAPHERDARQHIWVHGREFAAWVERQRRHSKDSSMAQEEGYCFGCRSIVRMVKPTRGSATREHLVHGNCPRCGGPVYRGMKDGVPRQLSES